MRKHERVPVRDLQPVGVGVERPPRRPKRLKSKGTFANPYVRATDGVETVKVTFSLSKVMAQKLQQFELNLKYDGISRSTWFEELVAYGIEKNFLRKDKEAPPSEPPPSEPPPPGAE